MSLPAYHNVSDEAPVVLIRGGDNDIVATSNNIVITNTHASNSVIIDLYVGIIAEGSTGAESYYIIKNKFLHIGESINLENKALSFPTNIYSLIIKLTGIGTTSPTADVLLN
tara:strand:- start:877 stop:1212 length:336 start_codon:yes stop_codon:yes gene_type:complete